MKKPTKNKNPKAFRPKKTPSERNLGHFVKNSQEVTTIYIGNMSYQKNEYDVRDLFATYGEVSYVRLMLDPKLNQSRGFAFVQMPTKKQALFAIDKLNGKKLDGRTLKVSIAKENPSLPVAKVAKKPQVEPEVEVEKEVKPTRRKRDKGLKLLFNHLNR